MATPERPGWYPAPSGGGEQWWNGVSWSESRRDGSVARQAQSHSAPARSSSPAAPAQNAAAVSNITPPTYRAPVVPAASTRPNPYAAPVAPPPYRGPAPNFSGAPAHAPPGTGRATTRSAGGVFPLIVGIGSLFLPFLGFVAIFVGIRALITAGRNPESAASTRVFGLLGLGLGVAGVALGSGWLLPMLTQLFS